MKYFRIEPTYKKSVVEFTYFRRPLEELTNKTINKTDIENKLKLIFEKNLSKMYKINNKLNK